MKRPQPGLGRSPRACSRTSGLAPRRCRLSPLRAKRCPWFEQPLLRPRYQRRGAVNNAPCNLRAVGHLAECGGVQDLIVLVTVSTADRIATRGTDRPSDYTKSIAFCTISHLSSSVGVQLVSCFRDIRATARTTAPAPTKGTRRPKHGEWIASKAAKFTSVNLR
jgi:hypothetical protein